jgi:hypothetical protein
MAPCVLDPYTHAGRRLTEADYFGTKLKIAGFAGQGSAADKVPHALRTLEVIDECVVPGVRPRDWHGVGASSNGMTIPWSYDGKKQKVLCLAFFGVSEPKKVMVMIFL